MLCAPNCTPYINVNIQNIVQYLYTIAIHLMRPFISVNKLGYSRDLFSFYLLH